MDILVISDEESASYWDYFQPEKVQGLDLILSCGDLDPDYLSFLVTMANCPLLYVHGNHDARYKVHAPEGCTCIEDKIYVHRGIRILGLGGACRYSDGPFQYTQGQMERRVRKMKWKIWRQGGFDILLAHAPAYGVDDADDRAHAGFRAFTRLMDAYQPKYFLHGHIHLRYGQEHVRRMEYGRTTIINGCGAYRFRYDA